MKLHGYFRSSAAYRVRLALHLKGISHDAAFVHLRRGEQHQPGYRRLNPQDLVPTLEDGPTVVTQSLAIIEYLEDTHPTPPLLPADPAGRARVRGLSLVVACDIHPLNNLRVLHYLTRELHVPDAARDGWYRHWIAEGLGALETMIAGHPATGRFCHGDTPTMADLCLVPQLYNADRYHCDLSAYPALRRIRAACEALPAFQAAHPDQQPDRE